MPGTAVAPPMTKMVAGLCAAKQGRAKNLRSTASSGVPDSITTATKMKKTRRFQIRQCGNWATRKSELLADLGENG